MSAPEFFLYLPQMRMDVDAVVERASAAEASGFRGMAFMDHMAPPLAESQPMYEAMTLATWVAARTTDLVVSHLVLCDVFRHPAVLARQAVTLDHASGGRFELGIGWGSIGAELVGIRDHRRRARRPGRRAWGRASSSSVPSGVESRSGIRAATSRSTAGASSPHPAAGSRSWWAGRGPRPSTWCAVTPTGGTFRSTPSTAWRSSARGPDTARVSTQHLLAHVADPSRRTEIAELATRRFGGMAGGPLIGDGDELVEHFRGLHERGVERFYCWFCDFAPVETLAAFGEQVIAALVR